ncbi:MAG: hypothetical protein ACFBRM_10065 [Pikeienuella sp.]
MAADICGEGGHDPARRREAAGPAPAPEQAQAPSPAAGPAGDPSVALQAAGLLTAAKKLRDHWLLVIAILSALFWLRDLVLRHAELPEIVAAHDLRLTEHGVRLDALEAAPDGRPWGHAPPEHAGGEVVGPLDGRPGAWSALEWRSAAAGDPSCTPETVTAVLVDAAGRWHVLEATLAPGGRGRSASGLRLGLRPGFGPVSGPARLRLRLSFLCKGFPQVERSDWLPFLLRDADRTAP